MAKRQIFKVQMPLVTSEPTPTCLIYNRQRTIYETFPVDDRIRNLMRGEFKRFFWGHYRRGTLDIGPDEAPWQDW
jgi:hypothetical protein